MVRDLSRKQFEAKLKAHGFEPVSVRRDELENWECEGDWHTRENTFFTGYDERCHACTTATEHTWNEHYEFVNETRTAG